MNMQARGQVRLGARWDESSQNARLSAAAAAGLIDYIEANYPISPAHPPRLAPAVPVLVHCPINAIASPQGVNFRLAEMVRAAADLHDSPWVGEHLCWAGSGVEGRLGYIVTPILCPEFQAVAVRNTRALSAFYGRKVALELAPVYQLSGSFDSELHFLAAVAEEADAFIIFDLAHWTASNRNLRRPADFGLDVLPLHRVVELHVAGIRPSNAGTAWHDSHDRLPEPSMLELAAELATNLPNLRAVTFEHADGAPEEDLMRTLDTLRRLLG